MKILCYSIFFSLALPSGLVFSANPIHAYPTQNEPDGILELPTEIQEAEVRRLDTELAEKIYHKFRNEWSSKGYKYLNVKVNNGVVSLTGLVEKESDKRKVEENIKNMAGVRRLNINLQVVNTEENETILHEESH
ncbi:MAG: BON domain-containing protein [Parachlamydiaceae bacterium]|nr:BON domain-containing protein [Parachlamydiaceae bacterium]